MQNKSIIASTFKIKICWFFSKNFFYNRICWVFSKNEFLQQNLLVFFKKKFFTTGFFIFKIKFFKLFSFICCTIAGAYSSTSKLAAAKMLAKAIRIVMWEFYLHPVNFSKKKPFPISWERLLLKPGIFRIVYLRLSLDHSKCFNICSLRHNNVVNTSRVSVSHFLSFKISFLHFTRFDQFT